MKKEVLKEKIVKILEGINEPVKTNYEIAEEIKELLKSEKEKNRQKFIETIEDVCKGLPFIQRQLKEAIKDEK